MTFTESVILTYTSMGDFFDAFQVRFPEFVSISDANLQLYYDAMACILPKGLEDMDIDCLMIMLMYSLAHILQYYDIKNNADGIKKLKKVVNSLSAGGLSTSFDNIQGSDNEPKALISFYQTTGYGTLVLQYIMNSGIFYSGGGFLV